MNSKITYGVIGLVIGVLGTWFLSAATLPGTSLNKGSMMSVRSSTTLDAHFIEQMIPHHEDAITMAKLAQTNAKRPEVKKLADTIIDSQSKEIQQMKSWYRSWFGREVPTGAEVMGQHGMMKNENTDRMHMGMMGDESDLDNLERVEDFDTAFVEAMIPHHQMAVMMANMLQDGTDRPEMKRLAEDIITAQAKEIDQMRQWLLDWAK